MENKFYLISLRRSRLNTFKDRIKILLFKKELSKEIKTIVYINKEEYKDYVLVQTNNLEIMKTQFSKFLNNKYTFPVNKMDLENILTSIVKAKVKVELKIGDYVQINLAKNHKKYGTINNINTIENKAIVEIKDSILSIPLEVSIEKLEKITS